MSMDFPPFVGGLPCAAVGWPCSRAASPPPWSPWLKGCDWLDHEEEEEEEEEQTDCAIEYLCDSVYEYYLTFPVVTQQLSSRFSVPSFPPAPQMASSSVVAVIVTADTCVYYAKGCTVGVSLICVRACVMCRST